MKEKLYIPLAAEPAGKPGSAERLTQSYPFEVHLWVTIAQRNAETQLRMFCVLGFARTDTYVSS
jgi:hypothetical protein